MENLEETPSFKKPIPDTTPACCHLAAQVSDDIPISRCPSRYFAHPKSLLTEPALIINIQNHSRIHLIFLRVAPHYRTRQNIRVDMDLQELKDRFRHKTKADLSDLDIALQAVPFLVRKVEALEAELSNYEKRVEHLA